jgi:hypothetical protein
MLSVRIRPYSRQQHVQQYGVLTTHANHPLLLFPSKSVNTSSPNRSLDPADLPALAPLAMMKTALRAMPMGVAQLLRSSSYASSLSSSETNSQKSRGSKKAVMRSNSGRRRTIRGIISVVCS